MKVGRTILGFDALDFIANAAPNAAEVKIHLGNLAMEEVQKAKERLGCEAGITFRAMYVEELNTEHGLLNGYMLDFKVGPAEPIDNPSLYTYTHYFAQFNEQGQFIQLHQISNYPEQES